MTVVQQSNRADKERFEKLLGALDEMKAHWRGEETGVRISFDGEPDPREIRARLGLMQEEEQLIRPHVIEEELEAAYSQMAQDAAREAEANDWVESLISDVGDETGQDRCVSLRMMRIDPSSPRLY